MTGALPMVLDVTKHVGSVICFKTASLEQYTTPTLYPHFRNAYTTASKLVRSSSRLSNCCDQKASEKANRYQDAERWVRVAADMLTKGWCETWRGVCFDWSKYLSVSSIWPIKSAHFPEVSRCARFEARQEKNLFV